MGSTLLIIERTTIDLLYLWVISQPAAPTENIEYEIPSGMIKQLLANPYAGDGTEHPDMHFIYVEQICGLFKLAGLPKDEVM